jgi:SAM-dependent methyltransferase
VIARGELLASTPGEPVTFDGPRFYDDPQVFATYRERRARADNPNDTLELPVMRELLGSPRGHCYLDLGCGDGRFAEELLAAGAASYLGIDGSHNMARVARERLAGTIGRAVQSTIESMTLSAESFDRVCSRLAFHYIEDLAPTFSMVRQSLKADGLFVFSVEHPVITSSAAAATESGLRERWIVDDYFVTGRRTTNWMGGQVVKYHRTVADYFAAVEAAGMQVVALRESRPDSAHFSDEALFRRRQRVPLFLFIAATPAVASR